MNIFQRILKFCKNAIMSIKYHDKLNVLDCNSTIQYILDHNASIGRFGDGELDLISGQGIRFQSYNKTLAQKLASLKTEEKFLVCIPNIFDKKSFNKKILTKGEYRFWVRYKLKNKYLWVKHFRNQPFCGDAMISRFYIRYNDKSGVKEYLQLLKKLWDNRNIIIVEGETSKIGCENDLLSNAKSIRRIIGPNKDAFDYYDELLNAVKENYNDGDLIILALGPTATVMAYDLYKCNIQALDLGHFDIEYEWYLANADEKIPVKNKHVNECGSIGETNTTDNDYKKEIIYKTKTK